MSDLHTDQATSTYIIPFSLFLIASYPTVPKLTSFHDVVKNTVATRVGCDPQLRPAALLSPQTGKYERSPTIFSSTH
jgi:hypothetical protein